MTSQWKDISSHSRNTPPADRVPCTFQLKAGPLTLTVTRHLHYDPLDWVASCNGVFPQRKVATGECALAAQQAAVALLAGYLTNALSELPRRKSA